MPNNKTTNEKITRNKKIDEIYIQNEIDKLNVNTLIQPEQNDALKKVIKTDRKIVVNLDEKISKLQKCCEYGKQVSKIINFKAEGLSTISLKEKLKLILETFNENFVDHNTINNNITLNFKTISKYFSTRTFSFCSLNYDSMPLNLFMNNVNTFNLETKEKKAYTRSKHFNNSYKKLKDYQYEKEHEIGLETYEESMKLKDRLKRIEKNQNNINFLNFIVDCDPINGYNETTFRLFLITLLVSKGHMEFYKDINNNLCIKSSNFFEYDTYDDVIYDQNKETKKKNQAILTSWSYSRWEKLANQLKNST